MRHITLCTLLLALSGCASLGSFRDFMDTQVGSSRSGLIERLGYNYLERREGERQILTWRWVEQGTTPGTYTSTRVQRINSGAISTLEITPGTYFPPTPYEHSCEMSFILKQDRVQAWRAQGEGCRYYPGPAPVYHSPRSKPNQQTDATD